MAFPDEDEAVEEREGVRRWQQVHAGWCGLLQPLTASTKNRTSGQRESEWLVGSFGELGDSCCGLFVRWTIP